jgi:hypothetical protein
MRRTTPLLALFPLALALGACGDDGGGSTEAFCSALEDVENIDEPTVEELEEVADTAPGEISDDMEVLLDFLRAIEEDGFEGVEDIDEDELDEAGQNVADFADEECGIDLDAGDDTGGGSTDDGATDDSGDDSTDDDSADDSGDDSGGAAGEPTEPPDLDDEGEADLAAQCFDGDLAACDRLYLETPIGSDGEAYGATCGGRLDNQDSAALCEQTLGEG